MVMKLKQTTRPGGLRLKKLSLWCVAAAAAILSLAAFVAGCSSVPVSLKRPVDAIELIDPESSFYIAVPKAVDTKLIERIVTGFYGNASASDAKMISERVTKIYCGLNRSKNETEVQAAIDGAIPLKYLPKVLSEKNGWVSSDYSPNNGTSSYKIYGNQIELAFPTDSLAVVGRDVEGMLDRFDSLSSLPFFGNTEIKSDLDPELISYLKGAESEIRFYANKPQSFLTILTGAQLDLKLIDVKGSFVVDSKHDNQYLLTLDFRFKNGTFLRAGKTLLILAFGLTNSQEEIIGDNELIIHDIKMNKEQLYKLLAL